MFQQFAPLSAMRVFLVMRASASFLFALSFTVNLIYQVTVVGLDPLQLVLVGTALEVTVFLFEIPTGVVADVYSRRLSVILGYLLLGIAFVIEGSIPMFSALLLAGFMGGIGYTFLSGASDAWLVDEIGEDKAQDSFLRGSQVAQLTGIIGIVVSVLIGSVIVNLPIVFAGLGFIGLALFLAMFMPEDGFTATPKAERETWKQMWTTLREGITLIRLSPILLSLVAVGFLYGAFSEGFDRLWTAHLLNNFTFPFIGEVDEVVWFGVIRIVTMFLSIVALTLIRRRVNLQHETTVIRTLILAYAGIAIGLLLFAQVSMFWLALMAVWWIQVVRTVMGPIFTAWINRHIDSSVRATVLSLYGQTDAIGQIGGGPIIGAIGTASTLRTALSLSALMLLPILPILTRISRRKTKILET